MSCILFTVLHVCFQLVLMYDGRLKYLNLNNNEIYSIPQLKLLGTSPLKHSELQQPRLSSSKITMDSTTPSTDHGAVSHDHLMDGNQTQTTDNTANHDPIENVQTTELKQQSLDASSPIIGEVKSNKSVTDETNALKSETLLPQAPPNTALPVGQTASRSNCQCPKTNDAITTRTSEINTMYSH